MTEKIGRREIDRTMRIDESCERKNRKRKKKKKKKRNSMYVTTTQKKNQWSKHTQLLIPLDSYLRSGLYVLCVRCACYKSVLVWGSFTFGIDCCPVLVNLKKKTEKPKIKNPKSD